MTLDDIRKLIEVLPPGPWVLDAGGMAILTPGRGDDQVRVQHEFITTARTLLPALLEVAERAKGLSDDVARWGSGNFSYENDKLADSLAALEAIKMP